MLPFASVAQWLDACVALKAKVSGSISGDTYYAQLVPIKYSGAQGEDYTREPSFFAKKNKIDLDFNEVVGSNHVTVAYDVLPTLRQEANTIGAHKLIDNDDGIRIGPINGKFLKHFYT